MDGTKILQELVPAVQTFTKSACAFATSVLEEEEENKQAAEKTLDHLKEMEAVQFEDSQKQAAVDRMGTDIQAVLGMTEKLAQRNVALQEKLLKAPIGEETQKSASANGELESDQVYIDRIDNLDALE